MNIMHSNFDLSQIFALQECQTCRATCINKGLAWSTFLKKLKMDGGK